MNVMLVMISVIVVLLIGLGIHIGYMIADDYYAEKEAEEEENERWQKLMAKQWFNEFQEEV